MGEMSFTLVLMLYSTVGIRQVHFGVTVLAGGTLVFHLAHNVDHHLAATL
jgi:hypothetical protein